MKGHGWGVVVGHDGWMDGWVDGWFQALITTVDTINRKNIELVVIKVMRVTK